jgi:muramidase (phage lysozyme)
LRQCESGGDYTIVSPGGTYRGAYQFNQGTWNSVASRWRPDLVGVDPAAASPEDQDAMARALYDEAGASPWPHCGRYL